MNFEIAGTSWL